MPLEHLKILFPQFYNDLQRHTANTEMREDFHSLFNQYLETPGKLNAWIQKFNQSHYQKSPQQRESGYGSQTGSQSKTLISAMNSQNPPAKDSYASLPRSSADNDLSFMNEIEFESYKAYLQQLVNKNGNNSSNTTSIQVNNLHTFLTSKSFLDDLHSSGGDKSMLYKKYSELEKVRETYKNFKQKLSAINKGVDIISRPYIFTTSSTTPTQQIPPAQQPQQQGPAVMRPPAPPTGATTMVPGITSPADNMNAPPLNASRGPLPPNKQGMPFPSQMNPAMGVQRPPPTNVALRPGQQQQMHPPVPGSNVPPRPKIEEQPPQKMVPQAFPPQRAVMPNKFLQLPRLVNVSPEQYEIAKSFCEALEKHTGEYWWRNIDLLLMETRFLFSFPDSLKNSLIIQIRIKVIPQDEYLSLKLSNQAGVINLDFESNRKREIVEWATKNRSMQNLSQILSLTYTWYEYVRHTFKPKPQQMTPIPPHMNMQQQYQQQQQRMAKMPMGYSNQN